MKEYIFNAISFMLTFKYFIWFTHNSPLTELKIAIDNNYPPYFLKKKMESIRVFCMINGKNGKIKQE